MNDDDVNRLKSAMAFGAYTRERPIHGPSDFIRRIMEIPISAQLKLSNQITIRKNAVDHKKYHEITVIFTFPFTTRKYMKKMMQLAKTQPELRHINLVKFEYCLEIRFEFYCFLNTDKIRHIQMRAQKYQVLESYTNLLAQGKTHELYHNSSLLKAENIKKTAQEVYEKHVAMFKSQMSEILSPQLYDLVNQSNVKSKQGNVIDDLVRLLQKYSKWEYTADSQFTILVLDWYRSFHFVTPPDPKDPEIKKQMDKLYNQAARPTLSMPGQGTLTFKPIGKREWNKLIPKTLAQFSTIA